MQTVMPVDLVLKRNNVKSASLFLSLGAATLINPIHKLAGLFAMLWSYRDLLFSPLLSEIFETNAETLPVVITMIRYVYVVKTSMY